MSLSLSHAGPPFARYIPSVPSEASDTGSEQGELSDASESTDGLNRQSESTRQHETAGEGPSLTDLTDTAPLLPVTVTLVSVVV